jgi:hypothetical protein
MKAREHTLSMIDWWKDAGVSRADLAVRRSDGAMLWHYDVPLDQLPLSWARAENTRHGDVYIRPARGYPWPLVFLDDVAEGLAVRIARKYDSLVVKTSQEGGCHVWLSCSCSLGEEERHQAQQWLASRAGADTASTSGEHLGRLAGLKNCKRGGTWVNVVTSSRRRRRWVPRAGDDVPLLGVAHPNPESPPSNEPPPPPNTEAANTAANTEAANTEAANTEATSQPTDTSPSGVEWGWVCGMLEAGLPPRQVYYRLIKRARSRRGTDTERYARHTVVKALARTRPVGKRM